MAVDPVRASAGWLALREPADAAARSTELVDELVSFLPRGDLVIHDLGSGTGAMARWLAPLLPAVQRWVLHDRDVDLLERADLADREVETRRDDVTRLDPEALADADLITASALLDMMTANELERFVRACETTGCPVLITLSVIGRAELTPADPLDREVMAAFNDHQQRDTMGGPLLGPNAFRAAVQAFTALGRDVLVRPSPWNLGPADAELATAWFDGWLAAALEQRPALSGALGTYARRRMAAEGSFAVAVHHKDLLVVPALR